VSERLEADSVGQAPDLAQTLAAAAQIGSEVPWVLAPQAVARLAELEGALLDAQRSLDQRDAALARRRAQGLLESAVAASFDDVTANVKLDRVRTVGVAVLAKSIGLLLPTTDGVETLHSVVDSCVAARQAACQEAYPPGDSALAKYDAVDVLEDALEMTPSEPVLLGVLADVLAASGRRAEAAGRMREQAHALVARERHDEALAALDRAASLDPRHPGTLLGRAEVLRIVGRHGEARTALEPISEGWPDDPRAGTIEALIRLADGDADGACVLLTRIVAGAPEAAWAHANLALALHASGDSDRAMLELDSALAIEGERPRRLLQKAAVLVDQGSAAEGRALIDRALEIDPNFTAALIARAEALRAVGLFDESLEAARAVVDRDPESPTARVVEGRVLHALGDLKSAERAFARAAERSPGWLWVQLELGELRIELEDFDGAAVAFDRALELNRRSAQALAGRAEADRRRGQLTSAQENVTLALEADPDSARALTGQAILLYEEEQLDEAEAQLRQALEQDPSVADTHAWLGEVLRLQRREDEALAALDSALKLEPGSPFALATRGRVLLQLWRTNEGVMNLKAALDASPDLTWARVPLADGLQDLGRRDEALIEYDRLLEEVDDPDAIRVRVGGLYLAESRYDDLYELASQILSRRADYVPAILLEAQTDLWLGRFDDGVAKLTRAIELEPANDWAFVLRGWSHRNLGESHAESARGDYERAIQLDPDYPDYRQKLGDVLTVVEGHDAARPHFEWVIERLGGEHDSLGPYSILVLGWSLSGLRRYSDAARSFRSALEIDPDDVGTRFDLALSLLASGRTPLAEREYQQGVRRAEGEHPQRRRCALLVAERELRETVARLPGAYHDDPETVADIRRAAQEIRARLIAELSALDASAAATSGSADPAP